MSNFPSYTHVVIVPKGERFDVMTNRCNLPMPIGQRLVKSALSLPQEKGKPIPHQNLTLDEALKNAPIFNDFIASQNK